MWIYEWQSWRKTNTVVCLSTFSSARDVCCHCHMFDASFAQDTPQVQSRCLPQVSSWVIEALDRGLNAAAVILTREYIRLQTHNMVCAAASSLIFTLPSIISPVHSSESQPRTRPCRRFIFYLSIYLSISSHHADSKSAYLTSQHGIIIKNLMMPRRTQWQAPRVTLRQCRLRMIKKPDKSLSAERKWLKTRQIGKTVCSDWQTVPNVGQSLDRLPRDSHFFSVVCLVVCHGVNYTVRGVAVSRHFVLPNDDTCAVLGKFQLTYCIWSSFYEDDRKQIICSYILSFKNNFYLPIWYRLLRCNKQPTSALWYCVRPIIRPIYQMFDEHRNANS